MNKKQLRAHLYQMNIPTYGNRIKKSDVERIISETECTEITSASLIPLDIITKVAEAIKNALKKGKTKANLEKLNEFVKSKTSGDLMDLAKSAVEYFKQGKLEWEDGLSLFQNQYQPGGYEIIPWSFLKRQFNYLSPSVEKRLPRAFVQHLDAKASIDVHAKLIKIFAGELRKLSEHPTYRKEMQKRERTIKNKEILDTMRKNDVTKIPESTDKKPATNISKKPTYFKKLSDEELKKLLTRWLYREGGKEDYSSFNLCYDRGLLDYALDIIIWCGLLSKDSTDPLERAAIARWENSKKKIKQEEKELFKNVEIWLDSNKDEYYIDLGILDETVTNGLSFDVGFDKNGKKYTETLLTKKVG